MTQYQSKRQKKIAEAKAAAKDKAKDKVAAVKNQVAMIKRGNRKALIIMPQPTGNPERDSLADLEAVKQAFKARLMSEIQERGLDSKHYFVLNFQTKKQRDTFLKKTGIWEFGNHYVDGCKLVAERRVTRFK
ncbi:hypothetical protein [Wielerella bovis]|uniref:hypothetical protein n=1 Tax=Wielerella bovis TaxID=2917790 RepID=UPI0020190F30|nr:hypothetical protein [Wielerella bovis]ULJ65925.1 hypothetical protein MIS31_06485 [Wielerella bovis]